MVSAKRSVSRSETTHDGRLVRRTLSLALLLAAALPALSGARAAAPEPPRQVVRRVVELWGIEFSAGHPADRPRALDVEAALLEDYDPSVAADAVAWLRSPLGARARRAERAAARDATPERLTAFIGRIRERRMPVERRALMVRIGALSGSNELARAAVDAMVERARRAPRGSDPRALARVLERRPDLRERMVRLSALWSLHYTYRSLSTADLAGIVLFRESPAGRWQRRALERARVESTGDAPAETGALPLAGALVARAAPPERSLPIRIRTSDVPSRPRDPGPRGVRVPARDTEPRGGADLAPGPRDMERAPTRPASLDPRA